MIAAESTVARKPIARVLNLMGLPYVSESTWLDRENVFAKQLTERKITLKTSGKTPQQNRHARADAAAMKCSEGTTMGNGNALTVESTRPS
jgi:hypothetical protein